MTFNMNVKLLVSLVMTLGLTRALEIESLAVPPVLVSGDSAVMSCYYTLPDTRLPELDIKWYHGASPSPFMVFLPDHWTSPHILDPELTSRIEILSSTASRLLFRLNNVTNNNAGLYSCKVSTYSDETLATRRLTVIDAPKIELSVADNGNGELGIVCDVTGTQTARLSVVISIGGRPVRSVQPGQQADNATSVRVEVTSPTHPRLSEYAVQCVVSVPDTRYTWTRETRVTIHAPERASVPYLALVSGASTPPGPHMLWPALLLCWIFIKLQTGR